MGMTGTAGFEANQVKSAARAQFGQRMSNIVSENELYGSFLIGTTSEDPL